MKNAVIYARYSSDRQREESIEGQIRVCKQYAERNDLNVIHIYTDRALTGRSDKRPEFQMMIRDSAKCTFQYVLVYKLNRFSRDRYDSAIYKHKLGKNCIKVISAMENITDDPAGKLLESVIEGIAEYYSAELSENVIRGMTQNAMEGKWAGGNLPLGYKLDSDKRLIIDENKVNIVRKIYDMFLTGFSVRQITNALNEEKLTTANGYAFSRSRVYSILHNERYLGTYIWKDIRIPHAIPQIISDATFELAQRKVKFMKKHCVKTNDKYLLSGKISCGACGSKVSGTSGTSRSGDKYFYYICSHHHKSNRYPYCETKNIRADILEGIVCQKTTELLSNKETIRAIAKQAIALQDSDSKNLEIKALENRIAETSKKVQNCVKAIERGIISDALSTSLSENEAVLEALKCELEKLKLMNDHGTLTEEKICFFFQSILDKAKETEKYKQILFTSLIRRVVISNDYIEIQYNYAEQLPLLVNPVKIDLCSYSDKHGGLSVHSYEHGTITIHFCKSYFFTRLNRNMCPA